MELLPFIYAHVTKIMIHERIKDHLVNMTDKRTDRLITQIVLEEMIGKRMSNVYVDQRRKQFFKDGDFFSRLSLSPPSALAPPRLSSFPKSARDSIFVDQRPSFLRGSLKGKLRHTLTVKNSPEARGGLTPF